MSEASRLAGTFVGIVAVIVVLAAVSPLLASPTGSETRTASTASSFDPDETLVDAPTENGSLAVPTDGESKVVVIDRTHANGFTREGIQPFVRALVDAGHEVRFYGSGGQQRQSRDLNTSLRGADAFVAIAPRQPYTPAEVRGVADFAERGGRVLMLAEPATTEVSGSLLSGMSVERLSTELTSLSSQFGMVVGTGYLYNMHENANNFQHVYATPDNGTGLTDGVDRAVFQRATQVTVANGSAETLLSATDRTRLATTRTNGSHGVAARNGNALVVGDSTFLGPSYYRDADNEALVENAIGFLVSGDKTPKPTPGPGPDRPAAGNRSAGEFTPPAGRPSP